MHISMPVSHPEFINIVPVNPLHSRCQVKVCYLGENRNKTNISKPVAIEMAKSLPGSPIVGHYNDKQGDFEEHNKLMSFEDGQYKVMPDTFPYGFVPPDAKVWFQDFQDDNQNIRTYLVTEGLLWTGQYPECQRIIERGNNQSMELDEESLKGNWAKSENKDIEFFIINEAIISKLCVLGENVEPCFEGAQIKKDFSLEIEEKFKDSMFNMLHEFKQALIEGGLKMPEIENTEIVGQEEIIVVPQEETIVVEESSIEEGIENFVKKEDEIPDKTEKEYAEKSEEVSEEDKTSEEDEDKKKYSLEEIPEYVSLLEEFSTLQTQFTELTSKYQLVEQEYSELKEFKNAAETKKKDELIQNFSLYLSNEDMKDVIENKATYSYDDIEAKLSVICVRNKVDFSSLEDKEEKPASTMTYALTDTEDSIPAWIKAVEKIAKR